MLHTNYLSKDPFNIPRFRSCRYSNANGLFFKASLQLLCDIKIIPSLIVTNDWFTGFTPAYGKCGAFGDVNPSRCAIMLNDIYV